ncbi:hypothetical protein RND71_024735 [Anisodus tanguticus]|uniref:Uncharacterized protein n=1 Tax=Anisodus tanguticus TaxID=243964 RepID=A0AAE1VBY3_9SOLA|nr:hypothetical protein RND71_024735 [Anisodus tanguticus]
MMAVEIAPSPNDTLFFSYSNIPTSYELPDGQTIEVGADRFKIPDILFNPSLVQTIPGMESFAETAASLCGLPQMESPQAARVKVLASGNATERRFRVEKAVNILPFILTAFTTTLKPSLFHK